MANFGNSLGGAFYNSPQIERYVDDQFFAFSRGNVFVATTNVGGGQSFTRTITYHPYSDGTSKCFYYVGHFNVPKELVNQLDKSDSIVVNNGQFQLYISNGLPKVYYPADSADVEVPFDLNPPSSSGHSKDKPSLSKFAIMIIS